MALPPSTPNIADVMQEIASAQSATQSNQATSSKIDAENQGMYDDLIRSVTQINSLQQDQTAIDSAQALQGEQRKVATANAFGTDILNPDNRIVYLANERAAAVDEAIARSKRASDLASTTIWDDPLAYLVQRPFLQREAAGADVAANRAKMIGDEIQNLNSNTQTTLKTQEALNTQFTAKEAEIVGQLKLLEGKDLIARAKIVKNGELQKDLADDYKFTEERVNWSLKAYDLGLKQEQWLEVRERRKAMQEAKVAEKLGMEQLLQVYNVGRKRMNQPTMDSVAEFTVAMKNPVLQKQFAQVIDFAMPYATLPEEAPTVYGGSVGEATVVMDTFSARLPQTAQSTQNFLSYLGQKSLEELKTQAATGKKITLEDKVAATNRIAMGQVVVDPKTKKEKVVNGEIQRMASDVEADLDSRTPNIYKAPSPALMQQAFASKQGTVVQSPLWNEVVAPLAAVVQNPSAEQIAKQALLKVSEGKVSPEVAAKFVSDYFSTAAQLNNSLQQYQTAGLPTQRTYNAVVTRPKVGFKEGFINTFSPLEIYSEEKAPLDMTNQQAVQRWMLSFSPNSKR